MDPNRPADRSRRPERLQAAGKNKTLKTRRWQNGANNQCAPPDGTFMSRDRQQECERDAADERYPDACRDEHLLHETEHRRIGPNRQTRQQVDERGGGADTHHVAADDRKHQV